MTALKKTKGISIFKLVIVSNDFLTDLNSIAIKKVEIDICKIFWYCEI